MYFGCFYLDREKDMIVSLDMEGDELTYVLSTPNHHTGNLINNLAKLCGLPVSRDEQGLKVIRGRIPCYIDAYNQPVYIFRLGNTKTANIYPDGRIEMKASVPSISKTLMSQTKDYQLDIARTIIKSYVPAPCKFHSDLHTHMNANLQPDLLIALGICHQIRYPLYYIRKLGLRCTKQQEAMLQQQREQTALRYRDSGLTGKYLERKINDNTFINFAAFMLESPENAAFNIPKIRASLAIMKDGQAVFTNIEKVYLYRYVFCKGIPAEDRIELHDIERIPDADIRDSLLQMIQDHQTDSYRNNTLFQDKLLWIARSYQKQGISYVEISDTTLVKKNGAPHMLKEVHEVMPEIMKETGVMIRFLAGIRRIPLTIVKDSIAPDDYLKENLQVLRAIADDPYVAGSDILGEEINDIREIRPVIAEIVSIAKDVPAFVVRIHAGENDSLRDNVANSIQCVADALEEGQAMPHVRIGHGLYTCNLNTPAGRALLRDLVDYGVTLEFQITSNVRLNNLSTIDHHPLKQYLKAGVGCVQGTDGSALYGTGSIDEQLSLMKLLNLTEEDMLAMRRSEQKIMDEGIDAFSLRMHGFTEKAGSQDVQAYYETRVAGITETKHSLYVEEKKLAGKDVFADMIHPLPEDKIPLILAGGSFNNDSHRTRISPDVSRMIDELLEKADPSRIFFIVGNRLAGYEKELLKKNKGRFDVFMFVPALVSEREAARIRKQEAGIRIAIEPSVMGLYKSIAYEVFKRQPSVLLALDGNSALANLVQEARNAKYPCRVFIYPHTRNLKAKVNTLQGYVTILDPMKNDMVDLIMPWL